MKELIKYLRDRGLVEEALLLSKGSHVLNLFMNKIDNIEAVEIAEVFKKIILLRILI